jgi:hypothetical protein
MHMHPSEVIMKIAKTLLTSFVTAAAFTFAAPALAEGDNGEGDNDSHPCDDKELGDDCEQDDGDNGTCQKDEEGEDELFCDATACETDCDNNTGGDDDVDVNADEVDVACSSTTGGSLVGAAAFGALLIALRRRR